MRQARARRRWLRRCCRPTATLRRRAESRRRSSHQSSGDASAWCLGLDTPEHPGPDGSHGETEQADHESVARVEVLERPPKHHHISGTAAAIEASVSRRTATGCRYGRGSGFDTCHSLPDVRRLRRHRIAGPIRRLYRPSADSPNPTASTHVPGSKQLTGPHLPVPPYKRHPARPGNASRVRRDRMTLWGRCVNRHPWFPIERPELDNSYLCPVCLERAETTRGIRRRRLSLRPRGKRSA